MRHRFDTIRTVIGIIAMIFLSSCGGSDGALIGPPPAPPPPPPPPPAAITVTTIPVFSLVSMLAPVAMMQAPGDSSRWFVIEQQGIVGVFPNMPNVTDSDASDFIDIRARVISGGEQGLLGMAFHPDYGIGNFEVFVSYTRINGNQRESVISRFHSNDNGLTLDTSMDDIILTIPQPFNNHNGGHIAFGPNGFLYAGWGDGGGSGDPNDHAQNTTDLLGTMMRIDVDGAMPYGIPAGNPFAANAANPCPGSGTRAGATAP